MSIFNKLIAQLPKSVLRILRIKMDSSQVQSSELTTDYWNNRWEEGRTEWHKTGTHPTLAEHFGKLVGNEKKQRFLFPLCGKSVDMKWVADQGHLVVGVDSSEKAAKNFFADHKMEFKMDAINMAPRGALIFSNLEETIRIFICNLFDFRSTVAGGQFHCVFDRGSLVAINPTDRPRYAKLMADLLIPGGKILAECFEYDPKIYGGPPHHVPEPHVREIYSPSFDVQQIEKEQSDDPKYKMRFNVDVMTRCIYLITRK